MKNSEHEKHLPHSPSTAPLKQILTAATIAASLGASLGINVEHVFAQDQTGRTAEYTTLYQLRIQQSTYFKQINEIHARQIKLHDRINRILAMSDQRKRADELRRIQPEEQALAAELNAVVSNEYKVMDQIKRLERPVNDTMNELNGVKAEETKGLPEMHNAETEERTMSIQIENNLQK